MTQPITCAGCQHAYAENALFCPNCGRPKLREATTDALIGKLLGERFQVQALLGQGASGTIYRAEHVTLRRKVAIKVLHDELSRDDLAVERFRREATTVAEIDNEHIVEIHDFGRAPDGRLYLAMELLEGETLDTVLAREGQLSVERAADVLIQVGEALMEAHAIGYVHRDLRPRNVYLANRRGKANFVKLLDFGLSKLVETDATAASTSLGMTFGDPRYMSPEQARGDRIDRRADIYQLGCVAYEMLTGSTPFTGNRVFDILTKQVTEIPAPLPTRRPGVPLWMEAAVAKMLAKDSENRFATTTRMVEALRRGLETGEVMDDEIARRRESIPPPSVSRVMQKMGMAPGSEPAKPTDTIQSLPPPAKPDSVELVRKRTGTPQLGMPVVPPAPVAPQPPVAEELAPVAGTIEPPIVIGPDSARDKPPSMPPPVANPVASPVVNQLATTTRDKPPSMPPPLEEPRAKAPTVPPVEPTRSKLPSVPPGASRIKRPTGDPSVSAVWYDDDDGDADRARKTISPSSTDLSYYDELPKRRRWGLIIGAIGLLLAGGIVFAMTREPEVKETEAPPPPSNKFVSSPVDAAPAQVIGEPDAAPVVSPDATEVAVQAPDAAPPTRPEKTEKVAKPERDRLVRDRPVRDRPEKPGNGGTFTPPGGDDIGRRPGGGSGSAPPPVVVKPKDPPPVSGQPDGSGASGSGSGSAGPGVSGADGPRDPYGEDPAPTPPLPPAPTPTPAPVAPEGSADFHSNQGTQQLASGNTAGAAASFKKAREIDPKNAAASIGLGEIALKQGLFGDAIAHLKRASRLAPKSARVFTLLGEAHLNANQNSEAKKAFKKALQLDPDNARARDGYNDAQSRAAGLNDD
ncbi:MAG TPA: protein kinase [Kofleriaceae bacterium]